MPPPIVLFTNETTIWFSSDFSITESGFEILYEVFSEGNINLYCEIPWR